MRRVVIGLAVVVACVTPCLGQGGRVAVFVQAAAPVPAADLELIRAYASQQCASIAAAKVSSSGEVMYAQRATSTYVGNSLSVEGLQRLAATLGVEYVIIYRIVRWENQISFRPERSLVMLGASSLFGATWQLLATPLGLLLGLEKEATVGLFATVLTASGGIRFTTSVTRTDRPLLSLLTADPVEAAKRAIQAATYELAIAL
jgi:hypothetical protein